MSSYSACPRCGRTAKLAFSSNWFPVSKCLKCGERYCKQCGGEQCPKCSATARMEVGKVYAKG